MLQYPSCITCDRRDGDGDGLCYWIKVVMHVIDVMAMLMEVRDNFKGLSL